jgi:hypothetical protein
LRLPSWSDRKDVAVADTLAVARSNLIERVSRRAKSHSPYRKAGGTTSYWR